MTQSTTVSDSRFQTWGKWLGTVNGALLGAALGFALVYALELALRHAAGTAPSAAATPGTPATDSAMSSAATASSLIVPVCFLLGIFLGQHLGNRVTVKSYKLLAGTTGVLLLATLWVLLSLARGR